ncbi:MAG: hypothetical protein KC442_10350, partial [Thermomicrobiales bacterium]|nr:hypothetical protein [Thermomicrobiales bacterium]
LTGAPGMLRDHTGTQAAPLDAPAGELAEGIGTVAVGPRTGAQLKGDVERVHQAKQDFDAWMSERGLGADKERLTSLAERLASDAGDAAGRGGTRVRNVIDATESPGDVLLDFMNVPMPSFDRETPQRRERDLNNPDWSWLLTPGAVAQQAGFEAGSFLRDRAEAGASAQSQRAKGAALGARMAGGNPLDMALAATGSLLGNGVPPLPSPGGDGTRDMIYIPREPGFTVEPISPTDLVQTIQGLTPRDPDQVLTGTTGNVRTSSGAQQENDFSWLDRFRTMLPGGDELPPVAYDPLSSAYVPREPGAEEIDPAIIERARAAADAAKQWASGLSWPEATRPNIDLAGMVGNYQPSAPSIGFPDIHLPGIDLGSLSVGLPSRGGGQPIDANAMYMPLPPAETIGNGEAPLVMRRADMPSVGNGQAPLAVRRADPAALSAVNPNALSMPLTPEPTLLDQARGVAGNAAQWVGERVPDVILPNIDLPNVSLPGRGPDPYVQAGDMYDPNRRVPINQPGTGPGGNAAPLDEVFTDQQAQRSGARSTTQPEGTNVTEKNGVQWVLGANGNYRGLVDPATGEYVTWPEDATPDQIEALIASVITPPAAANTAPGPATSSPVTTTASARSGSSVSTTSRSTSNGGGGSPRSDSSTGRESRSSDTSDSYDDGDDAPLRLEDFIQDFDGDGVISKRDRMQGKKAFEEAKAARSKKRRGKTRSRKTNDGFPFDRQPSPIRSTVLNAIAASQQG